jgi:arginyl-tRNA synthetase
VLESQRNAATRTTTLRRHRPVSRAGRLAQGPVVIRDQLIAALEAALDAAGYPVPDGGVEVAPPTDARQTADFTSNVAMQLAQPVARPPREIAARLVEVLDVQRPAHLERAEVAGPGFLNLYLSPTWLHEVVRAVVAGGDRFGHGHEYDGQRINLEFVSANPTGPIHAGAGRWIAVGDAIANLLAAQGAEVHREYYVNDAGRQLDTFAASLLARVRGEEPPADGYQGDYLIDMADQLRAARGGTDAVTLDDARASHLAIVAGIREELESIGVVFDTWYSEQSLHDAGAVDAVLDDLRRRGVVFEQDGATWLRTTDFGDTRDRVLLRSEGSPTYLLADIAYHRTKFERGWTHLIDIWGADHHGQVKSLQSGVEALGYPPGEPEVLLGQLVKLMRAGEPVRLSKRTGDIVTLADILDEVDPDVARLTFLLQGIDTAQTFDLDLVTARSMDNPVYYVQYAHARIASIGRRAAEAGVTRLPILDASLAPLVNEREVELMRALAQYPDVLLDAARLRAPHRVTTWVRDFAKSFHSFYRDCRVLSDDAALTQARLWLAEACGIALADALAILGVHAPDEMSRIDEDE